MQEIKLKVSHLYCGACVSNRQNGLGKMCGIAAVAVDSPDLGNLRQQARVPGCHLVQ